MMDRDELLAAARTDLLDIAAVAVLVGWQQRSISRYLSAGRFPAPDLRFGAAPVWHRDTVAEWQARRR
jgi:predicted DNA-binding transcriptional regulator AlpA